MKSISPDTCSIEALATQTDSLALFASMFSSASIFDMTCPCLPEEDGSEQLRAGYLVYSLLSEGVIYLQCLQHVAAVKLSGLGFATCLRQPAFSQ